MEKTLKHFIHFSSSYASAVLLLCIPGYHNGKCFPLGFFFSFAKPLNWYSSTPSNFKTNTYTVYYTPVIFFSIPCNSQSFIHPTAWHPLILIFQTLFLNGITAGSVKIQGQQCERDKGIFISCGNGMSVLTSCLWTCLWKYWHNFSLQSIQLLLIRIWVDVDYRQHYRGSTL